MSPGWFMSRRLHNWLVYSWLMTDGKGGGTQRVTVVVASASAAATAAHLTD